MYNETLLKQLFDTNSIIMNYWFSLQSVLNKVSVKEVSPGMFQIGEGCITGMDGLKAFDEALKNKIKLEYGE